MVRPYARGAVLMVLLTLRGLTAASDTPSVPAYPSIPSIPPIFGTTPDSSVEHWIKYVVLNQPNMPFPIVQISTQHFKLLGVAEDLIVLPANKYEVLATFTQLAIKQAPCTRLVAPPDHTLYITEHEGKENYECAMLQARACRYFLMSFGYVG